MKRMLALCCLLACGVCIFNGCASVDWEDVNYQTPASKANLKANAKIRLVAIDNKEMLDPLVKNLSQMLAKSGQFQITDGTPDYWLAFAGNTAFRMDDEKSATYNQTVKKVVVENETEGREVLKKANHRSSTATMVISVAVYSVKDLSPVYYFDVEAYDADFKGEGVRDTKAYGSLFADQLVTKIKDAFVCQKRMVSTALPRHGDSGMKYHLVEGEPAEAIKLGHDLVPESLEDFLKDVQAGKYLEQEDLKEAKLCNYYLLALAEEMENFEASNLRKLHGMHMMILNQTQDDGLIVAVPNSLARLEAKMKLMQTLK